MRHITSKIGVVKRLELVRVMDRKYLHRAPSQQQSELPTIIPNIVLEKQVLGVLSLIDLNELMCLLVIQVKANEAHLRLISLIS